MGKPTLRKSQLVERAKVMIDGSLDDKNKIAILMGFLAELEGDYAKVERILRTQRIQKSDAPA